MAKASDNPFPSVLVVEGAAPAAPSVGGQRLFIDSADHKLKRVNAIGGVTTIEGAAGSSAWSWATKTAAYTITATDTGILADATSGTITITLPTAVGATQLYAIAKKDSSANKVTLATTSAQTINGVSTKTLALQDDVVWLGSDGAGWRIAAQHLGDVVQLDYALGSDVAQVLTANTWADVIANQTFTVDDAASLIEVQVGGILLTGGTASAALMAARLVIDSAGTALNKTVGGDRHAASEYSNVLSGSVPVPLAGLTAGSHTVKLQVNSANADTAICSALSDANHYALQIRVVERKR